MAIYKHNRFSLNRRNFLQGAAVAGGALTGLLPIRKARAAGNTIKIGYLTSITGPRASFGVPAEHNLKHIQNLLKDGLTIAGKTYEVQILMRDTQSSPNRAASVGNDLVLREEVDLLLDDSNSDYVVGELCDQTGLPFIATMTQYEPFLAARGSSPDKGYPWSFLFCFGATDVSRNFVGQWDQVKTNKVMGDIYLDHPAGQSFADEKTGIPGEALKHGYKHISGGFFKPDSDDFTTQIATIKAGNPDILSGFMFDSQFSTFWTQAKQAGLNLEVATLAGPFLFPSGVEALGDAGDGVSSEVWWTPDVPFSSSLTGQTARQLADDWTSATGKQWTQPLGYMHALFEVAIEVLKRSNDPFDREAIRNAITGLDMETMVGPVNFKDSKIKSVAATQLAMGQWRKQKSGKFPFELLITSNTLAPDIKPVAQFKLLSEIRAGG